MKTSSTPKKGTPNLKLLMLALVFLLPVISSPLISSPTVNETTAVEPMYCGVTETDVVKYLQRNGYTVYSVEAEDNTCNAILTTSNSYQTRVLIQEGCILGWEDIQ